MRRHEIAYGILLILSIIDFALAAPVLVQVKRQASVDVVHIPKDTITVFGKRGGGYGDLEEVVVDSFSKGGTTVESSGSHASSSSAPARPDHVPTEVMQSAGLVPASSMANPGMSVEPLSPLSTAPTPYWFEDHYNANNGRPYSSGKPHFPDSSMGPSSPLSTAPTPNWFEDHNRNAVLDDVFPNNGGHPDSSTELSPLSTAPMPNWFEDHHNMNAVSPNNGHTESSDEPQFTAANPEPPMEPSSSSSSAGSRFI